jgi:cytochrome c peroxidase
MRSRRRSRARRIIVPVFAVVIAAITFVAGSGLANAGTDPNQQPFPDDSGLIRTISTTGLIDTSNPFFQSMGTNGRTCETCHVASVGMTITPEYAQDKFQETNGLSPLFSTVDGSNAPNADVSTLAARQAAYSMLLNRGTIRIGLPMPANADFQLVSVDDPYHFASASELSMFRRPLPSTNIAFVSAVMWDGRETANGRTIAQGLASQIVDAVRTHEQGTVVPTSTQQQQIITLERALFTAQYSNTDPGAGVLSINGATGGPGNLSTQNFYIGINDSMGQNPTGAHFVARSMHLYDGFNPAPPTGATAQQIAQGSIARGQAIFNTRTFTITQVLGFNDVGGNPSVLGTCSTCHDTPNIGSHSVAQFMRTGVAEVSRRTPDLPLYTFTCNANGQTVRLTDPGEGLITGKCADLGKFKVPSLRGLDARSPYFHDGSGTSLQNVLDFYNARFKIGFTPTEEADLEAFLSAL